MFVNYMKDRIWKWIFCSVMAGALSLCMFQGFDLDAHALSDQLPAAIAFSALLQIVLIAFGYRKPTILAGIATLIGCAVLFLVLLKVRGIDIVDELDSPTVIYIYPIVLFLTNVVVHLLSSVRVGLPILFVVGTWLISALKYLEYEKKPLCLILFMICCIGQFIQLNYQKNAMESIQYEPAFLQSGATSVLSVLLACGLSALLFLAVIVPLHPAVRDLTLLTQHIAIEQLQAAGIVTDDLVENPEETTDETDPDEQEKNREDPDSDAKKNENPEKENAGKRASGAGGSSRTAGKAIRHYRVIPWFVLLPVFAVAAIIGIIFLRFHMRKRRLNRILRMENRRKVESLYLELLRRFAILGFGRRPEDTPYRYAEKNHRSLDPFFRKKASLEELTDLYVRVRYGGHEATDEECRKFLPVYRDFYLTCRMMQGNLKYYLRYFFVL